jgi:ubiquitin related modifier 1
MATLPLVTVELSGGCELLFGKQTTLKLSELIPVGATLQHLVLILKEKYIVERPEQFVDPSGTTLRPGVLALVNDCDAEVVGGMSYVLENSDTVAFVSTLHGG